MSKTFTELTAEIHTVAIAKGWWEKPREMGEMIALAHSEISEALEEVRNGKLETYYTDVGAGGPRKPEGFYVELADAVIRLLDTAGSRKVDIVLDDGRVREFHPNLPTNLCRIHRQLSEAGLWGELLEQDWARAHFHEAMQQVISTIFALAKHLGKDLMPVVEEKMAYNRSRPYRHGGKAF